MDINTKALHFSRASNANLYTCLPGLMIIAQRTLAIGIMDFSVVCGQRGETLQNRYFSTGKSKVQYPKSPHNTTPLSEAVDLVPWVAGSLSYNPVHCCVLAGLVLATASRFDISIRWGGNWDCDHEPITDQDFQDLVHYEVR